MCGLSKVNNYGIGGTRLAHQMVPSEPPRKDLCFCGRAYDMDKNADMVVVYGGVNDFLHGDAPFGEIGDTTPATFCGGVYFLMNHLKTNFPGKPIVFMTPARCCFTRSGWITDDIVVSNYPNKRPDARPLIDYVQVILETAQQFNIPALDLYHRLPLDPHDSECFSTYTVDGLHFNDDGHAILAQTLKDFIDAL
jgi:lysophospholipase L1-like esterase